MAEKKGKGMPGFSMEGRDKDETRRLKAAAAGTIMKDQRRKAKERGASKEELDQQKLDDEMNMARIKHYSGMRGETDRGPDMGIPEVSDEIEKISAAPYKCGGKVKKKMASGGSCGSSMKKYASGGKVRGNGCCARPKKCKIR
jgi:hypothetical protein